MHVLYKTNKVFLGGYQTMFHLSKKADYAIRGMVYLASKETDEVASLKDIASFADASQTFLAKIFQQFNRIGVVRSHRGTGGGFLLGRPSRDITLLEIIEAVEGPMVVNECILGSVCNRDLTCPVHPVWKEVQQQMTEMLGSVTLERLAGRRPDNRQTHQS